jgi:cytochrome b561
VTRDREAWPASVVALHWASAVVILGLIAVGFAMRHGGLAASTVFDLFQQHKSFGFVALALILARLALRLGTAAPPSRATGGERKLAWAVQAGLYALPLAVIGAGWLAASSSPIPVPTRLFGLFTIPNLTRSDPALYAAASYAHAILAYAILALLAAHVAGALKHAFVNRDDTLTRMLGAGGREAAERRSP